jgi:hypothetical protein
MDAGLQRGFTGGWIPRDSARQTRASEREGERLRLCRTGDRQCAGF